MNTITTAPIDPALASNARLKGNRACRRGLASGSPASAFTLIELLVILAVLGVLAATLLPGLAKTRPNISAAQCQNNLRQLTAAWQMYSHDFGDVLIAAQDGLVGRTSWMGGSLNFAGNLSNWDTNVDIIKSPLWAYAGRNPALFKCPADQSTVVALGIRRPRVRSVSMNSAFGLGEWLSNQHDLVQTFWRLYGKGADVVIPAQTFVFADEHPASINDGVLNDPCTDAQPGDPPGAARIVDVPGSQHNGAGSFAFADGRAEIHKWVGTAIRPPFRTDTTLASFLAGDSFVDAQWLAANTTVRR